MANVYMKEWSLETWEDEVICRGYVYNSPKFKDGTRIHTSTIYKTELNEQEQVIIFYTYSGSRYVAPFDCLNYESKKLEKTREGLELLKIPSMFLEKAAVLAKQKAEEQLAALNEELENGDLYLEIGTSDIKNVFFKDHGTVYKVEREIHYGMMQDSYLYIIRGVVDFRHFEFRGRSLTTYHISDSIKRMVVHNTSNASISIDDREYPVGKTIQEIDHEDYLDGLISPDQVNGYAESDE